MFLPRFVSSCLRQAILADWMALAPDAAAQRWNNPTESALLMKVRARKERKNREGSDRVVAPQDLHSNIGVSLDPPVVRSCMSAECADPQK